MVTSELRTTPSVVTPLTRQFVVLYEIGENPFTTTIDPSVPYSSFRHAIGVLMELEQGTNEWDNFAIYPVRPRPPHLDPLTHDAFIFTMPQQILPGRAQILVRLQLYWDEECLRTEEATEIRVLHFPLWLDRESFLVNAYFRELCYLSGEDRSHVVVGGRIWRTNDGETRYVYDGMFATIRCPSPVRHISLWKGPVTFYWDATVPGRRAAGEYQVREDHHALNTRRLQQALESYLGPNCVTHAHVKAHTGVWQNEFVDAAAKRALTKHDINIPEQELRKIAQLPKHALTWLWYHVQPKTEGLPTFEYGLLSWHRRSDLTQLDPQAITAASFLPGYTHEPKLSSHLEFRLTIATYNCLSLGNLSEHAADVENAGITGQIPLLRSLAHNKGMHVIGLQECRTPKGLVTSATHIRICSGADEKGCFGVELWFDLRLPYAWKTDGTPVTFRRHSFAIVYASPRLMIVQHSAHEFPVIFVVGHAPHQGHDWHAVEQWWRDFQEALEPFRFADQIHFLDANARISGEATLHFGDLKDGPSNKDSSCLRDHASHFGMMAPSTFREWHYGPIHTWSHPNGRSKARLDYILVPIGWHPGVVDSFVDNEFHAPRSFQDHSCVTLRLAWVSTDPKECNTPCDLRFDLDAMCTEDGKAKIAQIWDSVPEISWQQNATVHMHELTVHLQEALAATFPRKKRMRHCTIASQNTLETFHRLTQSKRHLRTYHALVATVRLRFWFDSWRGRIWEESTHRWTAQLFRAFANISYLMPLQAKQLSKEVKADRRQYAGQVAKEAQNAPPHELYRAFRPLLPNRKTTGKAIKPLPQLVKKDGTRTKSVEEINQRWTEHFAALEGGSEASPHDFIKHSLEAQSQACLPSEWKPEDMPTLEMLEAAIHRMRCGKASGPDQLPAELFRASPKTAARYLMPLLLKFVCRLEEPLQCKGGSLIALYKGRGQHDDCKSFRAILLLSNVGKVIRSSMRGLVNDPYENSTEALQLGGKKRQQVVFGAQGVRHFLQHAKDIGASAGIVFADIASAFYTVIREVALGASTTDLDIAQVVKRLGLGPEVMPRLHRALQGDSCYAQLGATTACQSFLQQSLEHTWFGVNGQHFVATTKGSRPGDSWADVVFNILFSAILSEVKEQLTAQGLLLTIPAPSDRTIWKGTVPYSQPQPVWQATWADDLALLLKFTNPQKAPFELAHASSHLLQALRKYGMKVTLGAGKTEALLLLRGKGALAERRKIFSRADPSLPVFDEDCVVNLPLTTTYRHLGGQITTACNMMAEIRQRISKARSAFWRIAKSVLRNQHLDLKHRLQIFRAAVLATLLWGAGAWPWLSKQEYQLFQVAVWELYRLMMPPTFAAGVKIIPRIEKC